MVSNSALIEVERASPSTLYAFASGEGPEKASAPQCAAWKLETAAYALGWPEGFVIGSEAELIRNLRIGRETLREAIRIVERRGSMRMARGRFGGLTVARPSLHQVAEAFAVYLHAIGYRPNETSDLEGILGGLIAHEQEFVLRLARATGDALRALERGACRTAPGRVPGMAPRGTLFANPNVGAAAIAMRLIDAHPPEAEPTRLGSEWELSIAFQTSRLIMRQALCMLGDLDMIELRRGRAGGVFLKKPAPVAVVRQLFSYFAAEGHTPDSLIEAIWALNLANLRIAISRLSRWSKDERSSWVAGVHELLDRHDEPERWVHLQLALAVVASDPILDTLAKCIFCFQARTGPLLPSQPRRLADVLFTHEQAILAALASGRYDEAEASQRVAQAKMASALRAMGGSGSSLDG